MEKYDFFISHATKDKRAYVDGLVRELQKYDISIYYGEAPIGDDIKEWINSGINNCEFAIVIISKSFLNSEWTDYEIRKLLERQIMEERPLVLPLLYQISKTDLVIRYPSLESIAFKYARKYSKKEMARVLVNKLLARKNEQIGSKGFWEGENE